MSLSAEQNVEIEGVKRSETGRSFQRRKTLKMENMGI